MPEKTIAKIPLARCSLSRRLGAIVYDALIVTGLLLIAAAVASPLDQGNQQAFRDPLFTFYLFVVWFLYLGLCWIYGGMTVGMRAWRVVVMDDKGGKITWGASLLRFVTALLSFGSLGLGFAWSWLDPDKRCWHDMVSGTGLYHTPRTQSSKSRRPKT